MKHDVRKASRTRRRSCIRNYLHGVIGACAVFLLAMVANDDLQAQTNDAETTVVRAYFDDKTMVDELARDYAPWEVNHEQGYLVIGVDADGLETLRQRGFRVEIDAELTQFYDNPPIATTTALPGIPGYPCYRTVEETFASARQMVADFPQFASWVDIGDSWDKTNGNGGYDLMVLKLTNSAITGTKPKIFHMTSVHAREYTPAELNTRFAEYLLSNYGDDADATWLLDHHEFHLLLQANPDGRKLAESGQLWRKNVNRNACQASPNSRGIDLNRNFPFQWGCCGGSSANQCSETYRGSFGNSEVETQAIISYLNTIYDYRRPSDPGVPASPDTAGVFLDTHSYSELVLWPWGHTNNQTGNGAALTAFGRKLAAFNDYRPTQVPGLYIVDGGTMDFSYGDLGLASMSFELGTAFFQDCPTFENTILPDNLQALLYASKVARAPYRQAAAPDALNISLSSNSVEPGDPVTLSALIDDTRYNNSNGTQPTQNITDAEVYVDVPPWQAGAVPQALQAADGAFNQSAERVSASVDTTGLDEGRHTLFVRGRDTSGEWGAVSAVFLDVRQGNNGDEIWKDDFESNRGWTINANNNDTATTGQWQVADPEPTSGDGIVVQPGDAAGGQRALVTGAAAGGSVGAFDIDGGTTSATSPTVQLPSNGSAALAFDYFFAHLNNATTDDFFRVSVIDGSNTSTLFEQRGAASPRAGRWQRVNQNLDRFAGRNIRLLVEAADAGSGSLVEAGVDNILITGQGGSEPVTLSISDARVSEADGSATVTVSLSRAASSAVTVLAFTRAQSAVGGRDYYGFSRTLTIAAGVTSQPIRLTVLDDQASEPTETMSIRLVDAQNATIADGEGVVTIDDDDDNNGGGVELSISDLTVSESVGSARVQIRANRAPTTDVSVLAFTQRLTATPGQDYYGTSRRITLPAGQTQASLPVTVLNDSSTESTETVRVRITQPSNGASLGTDRAVLSITDDD